MKKILFCCLFAWLCAGVCCYLFEAYINPETNFFLRTASASDSWAKNKASELPDEPRYIFTGGSEVRSGISPELMLREFGLLAINNGGMAGYRLPALCSTAASYMRPGDFLVLSCPNERGHCECNMHGMKYAWFRCGADIFRFGLFSPTLSHLLGLWRGESGVLCMYVAKKVLRPDLLYKYDAHTVIHPDGWMDIRYKMADASELSPIPATISSLSQLVPVASSYMEFLPTVKRACAERKVKIVLYLPTRFSHESYRVANAWLALKLTQSGCRVLKDERLGCDADLSHYSDTSMHLATEGMIIQNRILAKSLQQENYWSEEELIAYLEKYGWGADGERLREPE